MSHASLGLSLPFSKLTRVVLDAAHVDTVGPNRSYSLNISSILEDVARCANKATGAHGGKLEVRMEGQGEGCARPLARHSPATHPQHGITPGWHRLAPLVSGVGCTVKTTRHHTRLAPLRTPNTSGLVSGAQSCTHPLPALYTPPRHHAACC